MNGWSAPVAAAVETARVDRGRLFALKIHHNRLSREAAIHSLRELPNGKWQVRIGGRVRGRLHQFHKPSAALQAVNDHYNDLMMRFLKKEKTEC